MPVRELRLVAAGGCVPWRHHGFESPEEPRFLLTLDVEFQ
jgi:hypothetical protein